MTEKPSFFIPIVYRDNKPSASKYIHQKVENYFYLTGKKAYVLGKTKDGNHEIVISKSHASIAEQIAKIASYATVIIPLVMLGAKAALRCQHDYQKINIQVELAKGIEIADERIAKIQSLMTKIENEENHDEIEWLGKGQENLVFRLKNDPSIVYKFSKSKRNSKRYENMITAKAACLASRLDLLVIPAAKIITIGNHQIIAEACLDIDFNQDAQIDLYYKSAQNLNKTMKQLATLIAKTKLSDVVERNFPIIKEQADFQGDRQIALVDLEHMKSASKGFTGGLAKGIIKMAATEKQVDEVIKQGRKKGVWLYGKETSKARKRRIKELKDNVGLQEFYKKHNISGKEALDVDINNLGLDLTSTAKVRFLNEKETVAQKELVFDEKTVTLQEVAEDVIAEINRQIQGSPDDASIKGKRSIVIFTSKEPFKQYLKIWDDVSGHWMDKIIQVLVEHQHLYKLDFYNNTGYFIQA